LPEDLVNLAVENNLEAIAITDHDTTESLAYARKAAADHAAEGKQLEIIPGIEVNTVWKDKEIHILGYYIDPEDDMLQDVIKAHKGSRVVQIQEMAQKLRTKGKLDITFDDIMSYCKDEVGTLGRPHVAKAIVAKGGAHSISDAFNRFLTPACETYVRRKTVTPHEAVEAIYESGGIPVVAHPGEMEIIEELAEDLMNYGLRGLEAYHRSHSPAVIEFHCTLAEKLGLIVTGGTDFHGTVDAYSKALARVTMPDFVYRELKNERQRLQMSAFKAS
jgi:hypothetical protein